MTPQQWATLTPYQQQQHIASYGPPPEHWPTHPYAFAPMSQSAYAPAYPPPVYAAPVVNVAVGGPSVVVQQRPIAHGFHLLMTILTGGLWAFVWIAIVIFRR